MSPGTRSHTSASITPVCRLKNVLAEAVKAFYLVLDKYTLADISKNRQALAKALMIRTA